MQAIITFILSVFSLASFGQQEDKLPDSLTAYQLNYTMMDSKHVKQLNPSVNIDTCSFFACNNQPIPQVAYHIKNNKNIWIVASLSDAGDYENGIDEIQKISDSKGQSALVIKGSWRSYGTGGGTGIYWLNIINTDSFPTIMLNIKYGCWDESFGDREHNGEGNYIEDFKREIKVLKNGISIGYSTEAFQNTFTAGHTRDECLTNIAGGNYILNNGKMQKIE